MAKINEYPQAATINNNDLFVIDQESGGNHSTKSASVAQIADKVTAQIGDPNGNISDSYDPAAAYVKGDLCIYENALYICTAPTTGDFDPSKWTATTIDSVIGSLSTITTTDKSSLVGAVNEVNKVETTNISTTGYSDVGIDLVKANKVVQFKFTGLKSLPTGGWTKIADLPSGYRPQMDTIEEIFDNANRKLRFKIEIGGSVYVYNYGTAISSDFNAYVNVTYIIA